MNADAKGRGRAVTVLTAGVAMLIASGPVRAEDLPRTHKATAGVDVSQQVEQAQERRHRECATARELVQWLGLSPTQARQLAPLLEEAATLHIQQFETQARLQGEMLEAYAAFAQEDSLNQGFSRDVERTTARLHHEEIEAHDDINGQLMQLERQAAAVLTDTQRMYVEEFHQRPWERRLVRSGEGAVRDYYRAAAAQAYRESQRTTLDEKRDELNQLNKHFHPRPEKLGRLLLHPAAALPICQSAGVRTTNAMDQALHVVQLGTPGCSMEQFERQRVELGQLRTEISNWNLINGLHLDVGQIERIAGAYDRVRGHLADLEEQKGRDAREERSALLFELEQHVEPILSTGQRTVLAEFKPCLIPPKNLKDPVRVGQANDTSGLERWLQRARRSKAERDGELVDDLLARESAHYGPLSAAEEQSRRALLLDTLTKIRRMSDVDFAVGQADLVTELTPRDQRQDLKQEVARLARAQGQPGPIAQFLLQPEFVDQLKMRADQLRKAKSVAKDRQRAKHSKRRQVSER